MAHPDQRAAGRIRRPGGGRQRVEKKCPDILVALEDLLRDSVAGDPMSGTVPVDNVIGEARFIAWPPSRWGLVRSVNIQPGE